MSWGTLWVWGRVSQKEGTVGANPEAGTYLVCSGEHEEARVGREE